MFGKTGDMFAKLQAAKKIAEEVKQNLENTILNVEGAGGDILVEINGNRKIKNISVAASLQHGDKQELEEQLLTTINRAIEKADKANEDEMKKAAGGFMPGLF